MSKTPTVGKQLLRIVPGPLDPSGYHKTMGTKVLMPDGTPVPCVYEITLSAGTNDVWSATIKAHVVAPDISANTWFDAPSKLALWRRVLLWVAGAREVEHTHFGSAAIEHRRVFRMR